MPVTIGPGWIVGEGWSIGSGEGGGGGAGIDNVTGYDQMPGPVTTGIFNNNLQDETATINDPVGFTINDDQATGVAILNLSASNQAFFDNYGTGFHTCTWGPGSTEASSTINVQVSGGGATLVFVILGQTGPATYNYPFTFS
jgi:hypothetical protein